MPLFTIASAAAKPIAFLSSSSAIVVSCRDYNIKKAEEQPPLYNYTNNVA
jgi:hypothetical protein